MQLVKLGPKGQVTIPKAILRKIGAERETPLLVEVTEEGGILLHPTAVYPIEIYSDERVKEFERENTAPPAVVAKVRKRLKKS